MLRLLFPESSVHFKISKTSLIFSLWWILISFCNHICWLSHPLTLSFRNPHLPFIFHVIICQLSVIYRMSFNLFKPKETSDLTEYNLRIVLCSEAIEGYSCNEIRLKLDCSVAALIFVCVDFACLQDLFIENIKTRKQFPPLPSCPKHKPAFLAAVPQAVSDVSELTVAPWISSWKTLIQNWQEATGQISSLLYCVFVHADRGFCWYAS